MGRTGQARRYMQKPLKCGIDVLMNNMIFSKIGALKMILRMRQCDLSRHHESTNITHKRSQIFKTNNTGEGAC